MPKQRVQVKVKKTYTYEKPEGLVLGLGDRVVLPGTSGGEFVGTVTALTSTYNGPCKEIIRIATPEDEA